LNRGVVRRWRRRRRTRHPRARVLRWVGRHRRGHSRGMGARAWQAIV